MKGIIFNLAEEVVTDAYGEDAWEDLLDASGVEGSYTSLGSYPDSELVALVTAASEKLGTSTDNVLRQLGEGAIPLLAERYPVFFTPHPTTSAFLATLNDVIHSEVKKLYPGADVPVFDFDLSDPDHLIIEYRSARRLCALAEGFIRGAAGHYGEVVSIEQPTCMLMGDDHCVLRCSFSPR